MSHTIAPTAHHKSTAGWFFQGDSFNKWKSTPSVLWIDGKRMLFSYSTTPSDRHLPCSGLRENCSLVSCSPSSLSVSTNSSTRSSSLIVKHVKALRKAGLAYFHFDFRDKNKQSRNNLLRSLLFQLSAQSDNFSGILSHLQSPICDSEGGTRQPTDGELTRCLKKMLSSSHTTPSASEDRQAVYLIIDGVDECPDRSESEIPSAQAEVLNLIEQLVGWHLPNLHLCVTSLLEVGKHTALKDSTTLSVSLHKQSGHQEDINGYVKSAVYSDPKMESWSEKDKKLVVETLRKKSNGV
jgi:hypothetical protein